MSHTKNSLSILYFAVILLSINGLFSKLIPLDAVSVTQMRSVVAALSLFIFALVRKRAYKLQGRNEYLSVYFIGIILGLHWITFYHSMQISTVAIGMLSLFTYPIITVFLEPFFFSKKRIEFADIMAGAFVLFGIFIMVRDNIDQFDNVMVQGVFWGVISAFLFSLRNLLQKYKHSTVSSDGLILHQVLAISVMLLFFVDIDSVTSLKVDDWVLLLLLGSISTATAHSLLSYCLKHFPAKSIAMISCLQPLFAALFAWIILEEIPSQGVMVGGLIIVSVAFYESVIRIKQ